MEYSVFPKRDHASLLRLVNQEEKQYRDQVTAAADLVLERRAHFVFLAGPSCSGKTTTSQALVDALSRHGKRVATISTDDFFFDQDLAPKNPDGTPNYDAVEHTDLASLTGCLQGLDRGEQVSFPSFDFVSGKRKEHAVTLNGEDFDIFIVEGIHALNDLLLSPLSSLSSVSFYLDVTKGVSLEENRVSFLPEDIRFLRRLIRDFKHRNADAPRTFSLWSNVLEAEKEILHPYKRNADCILGTDFSYELAVVKKEAVYLLEQVKEDSPFSEKAKKLNLALSHFPSLSEQVVPTDSVLREFID